MGKITADILHLAHPQFSLSVSKLKLKQKCLTHTHTRKKGKDHSLPTLRLKAKLKNLCKNTQIRNCKRVYRENMRCMLNRPQIA